mgnify:CR=1 FL=1
MELKNGSNLSDDDISALIAEGISANSTAFLEETETGEKPKGVGNPTEVALLLWLNSQGRNYLKLRENARVLDQLTFSTEAQVHGYACRITINRKENTLYKRCSRNCSGQM